MLAAWRPEWHSWAAVKPFVIRALQEGVSSEHTSEGQQSIPEPSSRLSGYDESRFVLGYAPIVTSFLTTVLKPIASIYHGAETPKLRAK